MFCSQCGNENQSTARFCQKCGSSLAEAAPSAMASDHPKVNKSAIWNPNAAANWSLIFTPAFGSYLQMVNWRALGEPDKAASSKNWLFVSLGMLSVYVLMGVYMDDSKVAGVLSRGIGFIFLLIWYLSSGRAQIKYVKEKLQTTYPRKPWSKVLLIGLVATFGFYFVAALVGQAIGVAK